MMESYKGKKVLVTGGTGFIGSRLAERLALEERAEVTVLVNSWYKATWVSRSSVKLIQGNITNVEEVEQAVKGNEIIFHCVGVGGSMEHAMKVNVEGTNNILKAALEHNVKRVVYLSTAAIHGAFFYEGMDEDATIIDSNDPYIKSKIEAEKIFHNFTRIGKVEGVIIRPTYVWGPCSPYYTIDVIRQMKVGKFLLVDDGKGACNAVHVDNVVDLCLLSGINEKAVGETFLIRDKDRLTWKQFYSFYAEMAGMDINKIKSISSVISISQKCSQQFQQWIIRWRSILVNKAKMNKDKSPVFSRFVFKGPAKVLKILLKQVDKMVPQMSESDMDTYRSNGFISLEKTRQILDYDPRVRVAAGMSDCKVWLKNQNFI